MTEKNCNAILKDKTEASHEELIEKLVECEAKQEHGKAKNIKGDRKHYDNDPYPIIDDDEVRDKNILEDMGASVEKPVLSPEEEMSAPNMSDGIITDTKREP